MTPKKPIRRDSSITVPREYRMPILREIDRLRWMLGEADYHAPFEVGYAKLAGAIAFSIAETAARVPAVAARMKKYKPSAWLETKEAEATPLDQIMNELDGEIISEKVSV